MTLQPSVGTLQDLIDATLHAVDPAAAVRRHVRRSDGSIEIDGVSFLLSDYDEVILVAVGKASVPMAIAVTELLGDVISTGIVVTKTGHLQSDVPFVRDNRFTVIEAGHPVPDESSMRAGRLVSERLRGLSPRTLVVACISGGASALMISPYPGIRLVTMQAINSALLRCGADITEMNTVRSRLEILKYGGFVQHASPAKVVGLILSDVIGDPLNIIASGLTNHPAAHNVLVANNTQACSAAAEAVRKQGYIAKVVTTELHGEARERGQEIARAILAEPAGTCMIYGGEPTVTIKGTGKGGRNQELALAAALGLSQQPELPACVIALGTDGTDGPTDAAGAIAYSDTIARGAALGMEAQVHLANNDSYPYFTALGDLIMTGPTGTNVADVIIALRLPASAV